jgi:hypothetical protein
MKTLYIILLAGFCFPWRANAQVVFEKIDTTMKIGKYGFHVTCRNKEIVSNQMSIRPIGYESPANQSMNVPIKGRLSAVQVDDLNGDGLADLILFIYSDSAAIHGTVLALVSGDEKSLLPCPLSDPALDGKISTGYKGHDTFMMLEGTLLLRFPIYKPDDKDDHPTGGTRTVQYNVIRGDSRSYKFNMLRSYDSH